MKGKPVPVVFALHGGATSTGLAMHLKVDYTELADREGFVVVYPSGVNGWNIGSHDAYSVERRTHNADDLGFFKAMFDAREKKGVADPKRIYVTGGSNGGVMIQYFACAMPERIAGIGVMVATLPKAAEKDWPKPKLPVPTVIMLGTKDTFKPWEGSKDQFSAVETVAFWRKPNGCDEKSTKKEFPRLRPERRVPGVLRVVGGESSGRLLHPWRPRTRLADAEGHRGHRHRPENPRYFRPRGVLELLQGQGR